MDNLTDFCLKILNIPSPTQQEGEVLKFIKSYLSNSPLKMLEYDNSVIFHNELREDREHIAFVGHVDVVPEFFTAQVKKERIYGAGASDMKGAIACFLHVWEKFNKKFNLSLIIYSKEEGTRMEDNGLYELISKYKEHLKKIDLAIVGEPTNSEIHLGALGSLHAKVTFTGQSCHSARPWDGKNALYLAQEFIKKMSLLKPIKHQIFGVDFFEVLQITLSESEGGRTTLPGFWCCNLNYRYPPSFSTTEAEKKLEEQLIKLGLEKKQIEILDNAMPGAIIENKLFLRFIEKAQIKIAAKQAWTDVAQLTNLGIASLNWGPGLTRQAHQDNEYILVKDLEEYCKKLIRVLAST